MLEGAGIFGVISQIAKELKQLMLAYGLFSGVFRVQRWAVFNPGKSSSSTKNTKKHENVQTDKNDTQRMNGSNILRY